MSNSLESIVDETKLAFLHAKSDEKLDAGEIVQIAVGVAQKLQRLPALSGAEKKAVALLTLRRGLAAAGGMESLPGLASASAETKAAVETQLIAAAGAALDIAVAVAAGKIDLRKPATWRVLCPPLCSAVAVAFLPKDMPLLKEALEVAGAALPAAASPQEQTPVPSLQQSAEADASAPRSPSPAAEPPAPPATESETVPNPEAFAEASLAPSGEVKFE